MSGISRRVSRNINKKQHKELGKAWKVAKRLQTKKLSEGPLSDEDKAQYMPNGRMLGRKPTFKEFVDLKIDKLSKAPNFEAPHRDPLPLPSVDDEDLDWEE